MKKRKKPNTKVRELKRELREVAAELRGLERAANAKRSHWNGLNRAIEKEEFRERCESALNADAYQYLLRTGAFR